ncbi:MAG: hypothetical protein RID53_34915 [Coleofasciculus sp. B1-GNL1-01]
MVDLGRYTQSVDQVAVKHLGKKFWTSILIDDPANAELISPGLCIIKYIFWESFCSFPMR